MQGVDSRVLAAEVALLRPQQTLDASGDLRVCLATADRIPHLLHEIGRLREITFRRAGEGTGRSIDLDAFDQSYLHLFVWNAAKEEVIAAYRLQTIDGPQSIYTQTLFRFDQRFFEEIGPSIELGRSFVRPEYQKGFAPLLLLWKGIGKFVASHPQYKTLFGPVSISSHYQAVSQELMIAFLERRASVKEWVQLVRARNAPTRLNQPTFCGDVDELNDVIRDIEPASMGIPVLLRQYLKLGGKLLSFNVDRAFSNTLDGLIVVDLTKTEPKLRERYLGKTEAQRFAAFHQKETFQQ